MHANEDILKHRKLFIKLMLGFMAVILVPLFSFYFLLESKTGNLPLELEKIGLDLAQTKLESDVHTALQVLQLKQLNVQHQLDQLAALSDFRTLVVQANSGAIQKWIESNSGTQPLDFLHVLDKNGRQIATSTDDYSAHVLVKEALAGHVAHSLILESAKFFSRVATTENATIKVFPTIDSYQVSYADLTTGLFIEAAVPVYSQAGQLIGAIHAGVLIHANSSLIQTLIEACFPENPASIVSFFSGPVTVATNLLAADSSQALGTLATYTCGVEVLEKKKNLVEIVRIKGQPYLCANTPLFDLSGNTLGILQVGVLKAQYIKNHIEKGEAIKARLQDVYWVSVLLGLIVTFIVAAIFAQRLTDPIRRMVIQTVGVTHGDLRGRVKVHRRDEIGQLAFSINQMTEKLNYIVTKIKNAGININQYAQQMSDSINTQASATNQQSAAINQTTATMEEVATSSKQIAESSNFVAETALTTQENARKGVDAINATLVQMNEIWSRNERSAQEIMNLGNKSKEIGEVMEIINSIADQTKLIAFNAAIESSGDSEAEKRFSIVASEIRRLADSVMQSTEEIRQKIEEIQEATNELSISSEEGTKKLAVGLEHTKVTNNSLSEILEAANMTAESARQISLATQQQKTASEQVVIALQEIYDGTRQVVDSNKTTVEIAEYLKRLSKELQELIENFSAQ